MKQLCIALLLLAFVQASLGQLSGSLRGTLGPRNYDIIGDIRVDLSDTLRLMPGTIFDFDGPYPFEIRGTILAEGTESDPIIFTTDTLANPDRWRGFQFAGSTSSGRLFYCLIENSFATGEGPQNYGGGVKCWDSSLLIFENCTIRGNRAASRGGGIYCSRCSPIFANCIISDNKANSWCGGGVFSNEASPSFVDCIISDNSAGDDGGGVECYGYSSVTMTNCTISNNSGSWGGGVSSAGSILSMTNCVIKGNAASHGGGVSCYETLLTMTGCTISENSTRQSGGGMYFYDCYPATITNCTITNNSASDDGGGIYCSFSSPDFIRCTLSGNSAGGDGGGVYCGWCSSIFNSTIIAFSGGVAVYFDYNSAGSQFKYCDFSGNSASFVGDIPAELGQIVTTNTNNDSCNSYYNIFLNPIFVDTLAGDYHLQTGSFCIDAGDPSLSLDPDNTIADIGAFYFYQSDAEPFVELLPTAHGLHPNWPNPFNATTTIRYDVIRAGEVRLLVFDLLGREVTTLVDDRHLAGSYTISWNATNYPSGVYICHLEMPGFSASRKMVLLK